MSVNKKDVVNLLENIALYMELKGDNAFKISAYRKAAEGLERDERSLAEIDDFTKIKGIGKGTNEVIVEYIKNETSQTLIDLEEETPSGLLPLLRLPGLGGKRISQLYQELGILDADSLKEACENGDVEKLPGFGQKTVENILQSLDESSRRPERLPIGMMVPIADGIEQYLETIPEVEFFSLAGSLRRKRETIKDIDFIIATSDPEKVRHALLKMKNIKDIIAKGDTKVSITVKADYDINIDFRLVNKKEFATTLHHFTGSKDHNIAMRQLAKERGEKINEYGIEVEDKQEILTFDTEKDFFAHFNLTYIPPEVRENSGELTAYETDVSLIKQTDIRGDLHMHTTWSDGGQSVEEMVNKAREKDYEYIAITDHSKYLRVANGLNESRLKRQREEIDILNEKYQDIHIFSGVEMDILPDGTLDFSTEFLTEMDYVIGAIHSSFNQTREELMKRIFKAMDNPYVNLIAHPTGRLIGRREGYDVDVSQIIDRAIETNTALEINANLNRLDLNYKWAREAQEKGAILAINTDAHSFDMLEDMKHGVDVARKGWLGKETVINTWSKDKLTKFFNRNK